MWQDNALNYGVSKIEHNMNTLTEFPESCNGTEWNLIQSERGARGHWVNGFWVGLLWLAYGCTDDSRYEMAARQWAEKLAWLKDSTETHDLGFIFYLSHVLGAKITDDTSLYDNALQASESLIKRYNAKGEYLQAWGALDGSRKDSGRINIDVMMNLELLFWASAYSGDPKYADIATQHARTSRTTLVRHDGSVAQVGDFDPDTGLFVHQETHQGFSYDSCWSRGLGWAMYGFSACHRYTANPAFLSTSIATVDYIKYNLPDDLVAYWDFNSPDIPDTYRDTSASAVFACGLIDIAGQLSDSTQAEQYIELAKRIVQALWENYSSRGTDLPAIILQASRSVPHGYMDQALIYGDYYFFEALVRLYKPEFASRIFSQVQ